MAVIPVGISRISTDTPLPFQVRAMLFARDGGLLVIWVALLILFSIWGAPYFASVGNALQILSAAAMTAVFAASLGLGVMAGVLDLSVPGSAAFASVIAGVMIQANLPVVLALATGLAVGVAIGLVNGAITIRGFNPLIVTIGMLSVLSGFAAIVSGGYNISGLSSLEFMGTASYLGIPASVYIAGTLYFVLWFFLTKTRGGIRLMAVGANGEAVRRVGLSANYYRVVAFAIVGFCAALGGLVQTAYVSQASPTADVSVIFNSLTAVALAGVGLQGGRGSLPRVLLGAIVIETISDGLTIAGVQPYWATAATGFLLIGAISLDRLLTRNISRVLVQQGA